MKEKILKILKENSRYDSRYLGGEEVQTISYLNSEEQEMESFLSQIAEEIEKELKK